jgi:Family of unknown function (DUF6186)
VTSHNVTVAGYALILLAGVGLEVASRRGGSAIPSLRQVLGRVLRSRAGRVAVIAAWAWVGLHFFAL